jgi:hypothetical protein
MNHSITQIMRQLQVFERSYQLFRTIPPNSWLANAKTAPGHLNDFAGRGVRIFAGGPRGDADASGRRLGPLFAGTPDQFQVAPPKST